MAIEQTDANAAWSYRIDPTDPCVILRKRNRKGARWESKPYRTYHNKHDARAALLRLDIIAESEVGK